MTKDEKQVLKSFLALLAFKAILYISINQAAKAARKALVGYKVEPGAHQTPFWVQTGTDKLGAHMELRSEQ